MALTRLGILMLLLAACAVPACGRRGSVSTTAPASTATPTTKPAVDGPGLNAGLTDVEIIRRFGLDPESAKRVFVQGKDGTSTTFTVGNQQVTVTRSLVSGVTVMASGPKSGNWALGKP